MSQTIFFSPFATLWVHAFPEALIADSLKSLGPVQYITCDRLFSNYCIAMSASRLKIDSTAEEKEKVCRDCRARASIIRDSFKFEGNDLNTYIDTTDHEKIDHFMKNISQSNITEFKIDGIEIGKKSLYESLLHFKKKRIEFSDIEWKRCLTAFRNCLLTYYGAKKILSGNNVRAVVVYNSLYSVTSVFCAVAQSLGIKTYYLHASLNIEYNYEGFYLSEGHAFKFAMEQRKVWPKFQSIPCSSYELSRITDHFMALLEAKNVLVYSSAKTDGSLNIREKFGIRPEQKILIASLSSMDEIFAAEFVGAASYEHKTMFRDQVDWIQFLIREIGKRPEWFLLIRPHPREFPNRREGNLSEQGMIWKEKLKNLPQNIRVNWSDDGVSVYDLAEEADVFLNSLSTVGREMSLLGIPVVLYSSEITNYPADLNYVGDTESTYLAQIERALKDGWSFDSVRRSYRWHVLELERSLFDVSDGFPYRQDWEFGKVEKLIRRILRKIDPYFQEKFDCWKRPRTLKSAPAIRRLIGEGANSILDFPETFRSDVSLDQETGFLNDELRRILKTLTKDGSRPQSKLATDISRYLKSLGATSR